MTLEFIGPIDHGVFATVYKAKDALGRFVAVKIISPSMSIVADAMTHAKALARAEHPNVVRVYSITRVIDPKTHEEADAIVMEFIEGTTLHEHLSKNLLSAAQVAQYGHELIAGIMYIHSQGLAHGDLHGGNVMVGAGGIKILDILYGDSLKILGTTTQDQRRAQDINGLRFLLSDLIRHSELDPGEVAEFQNALGSSDSMDTIQEVFDATLSAGATGNDARMIEMSWQRFTDEGFVSGASFANAMLDETPPRIRRIIFERIIDNDAVRICHQDYISALWGTLDGPGKRAIISKIQQKLETEVPKGRWSPHVRTLRTLGEEGWQMISRVTRLRLEHAITNDILSGYKDIYSIGGRINNGVLGTWALSLGQRFEDRDQLIKNIASMLRTDWYRQNYIADCLFPLLPAICDNADRRATIIAAIKVAVANNARLVISNMMALPLDWQQQIKEPEPGP